MDFMLTRYRNLTILLVVIVAQLILIAYQVKSNRDLPLVRVWTVSALAPVEHVLEIVRQNTWGFVEQYFALIGTHQENERLKHELGQLKLENVYLKNQLTTADRAQALSVFQAHTASKTLPAEIVGNGTSPNSKVAYIDRGSNAGVEDGMGVITPEGIVGKVVSVYPSAALVQLVTDSGFGAGVISQVHHVRGTLKGQGHDGSVIVDYVQNEEKVDSGEWFFTSGEDRIFPRGFPVGRVSAVRNGRTTKEIFVSPSALASGINEVLVVLEGIHQTIPEPELANNNYKLIAPPPDASAAASPDQASAAMTTEADKLRQEYREVGQAQNHVFGEGLPGSKPPDFSKVGQAKTSAPKPAAPGMSGSAAADDPASAAHVAKPASGTPGAAVAKVKPKTAAPVLQTDPSDADPTETTAPARTVGREEKLDEFGQPVTPARRPSAGTGTPGTPRANALNPIAPSATVRPKPKPTVVPAAPPPPPSPVP